MDTGLVCGGLVSAGVRERMKTKALGWGTSEAHPLESVLTMGLCAQWNNVLICRLCFHSSTGRPTGQKMFIEKMIYYSLTAPPMRRVHGVMKGHTREQQGWWQTERGQ